MSTSKTAVKLWLALNCLMIIAMVVVGGITRLTNSGLSIVDWKPIMGAIPPLSLHEWQQAFAQYQRYPQYKLLNAGMSLHEFKFIFFWEYLHRLLGRLIGVVFMVPWIYFLLRRRIQGAFAVKLFIGFLLGGLQGALGWFMVKSGLVNEPHVSHYRLAAHLLLALSVLGYLFWLWLEMDESHPVAAPKSIVRPRALIILLNLITCIVMLQITYGAFTAGLKAGFGYNTFPKMNGSWITPDALQMLPLWRNAFENPAGVQFIHRTLGWTLLLTTLYFAWLSGRFELKPTLRRSISIFAWAVCSQFTLGVLTLLFIVPIGVASLHQFGACMVFISLLFCHFKLRQPA